jgi:mannose-6-phosphate isomerase-like protein (cupin superfamily)
VTASASLSRTLTDLVLAATDAYGATGDARAIAAAKRLRTVTMVPAPPPPGPQPPALKDLTAGLAAMPEGPLSDLIRAAAAEVTWTGGVFKMPDGFAGRYAYVEIVGPDGMVACPKLRFGLYLQSPDTYYPPHDHAAEEYYYVVGGGARWQIDDGPFFDAPPGALIHHKPHQRHTMETAADPLLAMWIWTGDIRVETYRIDGG